MEVVKMPTLIVGDNDLACDCKDTTLENMTLGSLNFIMADLSRFGVVVYEGKRGTKILKANHFSCGVVGCKG